MIVLPLLLVLAVSVSNLRAKTLSFHDRVIHVHRKGIDGENCLAGWEASQVSPDQYCNSMEFIANKLSNSGSQNVTIILESRIKIKSVITYSNIEFLTIQGRSKDTDLSCSCYKTNVSIGILFIHIKTLKLKQFNVRRCCGVLNNYIAGILIHNCSNVSIENCLTHSNYGGGLILVSPSGQVNIQKCKFSSNGLTGLPDGRMWGGLYIEFSHHTLAAVIISFCEFSNNRIFAQRVRNTEPIPLDVMKKREWKRQATGGGMAIMLLGGANSVRINISNNNFTKNRANWGGGLCIYVQKETCNNSVFVLNSNFIDNHALWGGGGLQITLGEFNKESQNQVLIKGTTFVNNNAVFAGGTSVITLLLSYVPKPGEILEFINCTWRGNTGWYNPAIDLSPYKYKLLKQGYSPIPVFRDIKIQNNVNIRSTYGASNVSQGVFAITRLTVHFQGHIWFEDNLYAALYLRSGRAVFANCSVYFYRNQGLSGGAIAINSFSALVVNDDSHFVFVNNSAAGVGGGIYYSTIDQRECYNEQTCFLEYGGKENNVSRRNISRLCKFGILFYILSDIVPTTMFFTIVITLGISFSSGALNGFVFFCQVVDIFSQDLIFSQSYNQAEVVNVLQAGYRLVYGIFNIEFFSVFSFCLWEDATVLDILAFKYVTVAFAFALIAVIVIVMNISWMSMRCMLTCKVKTRWLRKNSSVTHGISTFLLICYGQYTRVSFFILTKTYLQGKPGVKSIPVTYYGGLPYFSNAHLIYAIPAIICTVILVALPPFILLLYPLFFISFLCVDSVSIQF